MTVLPGKLSVEYRTDVGLQPIHFRIFLWFELSECYPKNNFIRWLFVIFRLDGGYHDCGASRDVRFARMYHIV